MLFIHMTLVQFLYYLFRFRILTMTLDKLHLTKIRFRRMHGIYHYTNWYYSRHLHNVEHVTFVSFHNSIDMQTEFPEYYEKKRLYSLCSNELYSCTICLPTILLIAKLLSYLFENFHDTRNNHLLHFLP